MFLHVKLAFLLLYLNNNFVGSYHNFILNYIEKSGFIINSDNSICIDNKKINIPQIPKFETKKEFKENILGSQYFIN